MDFVTDDQHKFAAYIGGIGAGKSFAGALKALRRAKLYPGSLGLIGAPTYPMLRDATLRSVFQIFPASWTRNFNKTDGLMKLPNGSEILFRSTDDPEKLRGPNLAWFWLDEAPLCGYYAWQILKGRLRQVEQPQGWITGSPKGRDGFWRDFEETVQPGHKLFRASTRDNEDNLPETFIEDLGYTGQFALQEIEGLFVSFEGLVYQFYPELHVGLWPATLADGNPRRPSRRIGGIDWGYTNPSVALPLWVDGDDRAYVLDEFYQRKVGLAGLLPAVLEFTRQYRIDTWYCGPDEPEHIADLNAAFAREKLDSHALAANDEINAGIETVRRLMALRSDQTTGLHIAPQCVQTRAELLTYAYPGVPEGVTAKRDPQDKPVKAFDHAMDALRYATHSALGSTGRTRHMTSAMVTELSGAGVSEIGGLKIMRKVL